MLVFAVTEASGDAVDAEFFDLPVELMVTGEVAAAVVDGDVPPAVTDETLTAHARVIDSIASSRACLPHRFGVIVDATEIVADLERNHDVLVDALALVRDADEWLARLRLRPQPAADHVLSLVRDRPPSGDAIETGRWVHQLVADWLAGAADELRDAVAQRSRTAEVELHGDALGADLTLVADRRHDADDVGALVADVASGWGTIAEFELFGPTPCFRSAGRLVGALHAEAAA